MLRAVIQEYVPTSSWRALTNRFNSLTKKTTIRPSIISRHRCYGVRGIPIDMMMYFFNIKVLRLEHAVSLVFYPGIRTKAHFHPQSSLMCRIHGQHLSMTTCLAKGSPRALCQRTQ